LRKVVGIGRIFVVVVAIGILVDLMRRIKRAIRMVLWVVEGTSRLLWFAHGQGNICLQKVTGPR
jgi:hypothetical protein